MSAKEVEGPSVPGKGMVQRHGWEPRGAVASARPGWPVLPPISRLQGLGELVGVCASPWALTLARVHPDEASGGQARPTLSHTPTSSREDSQLGVGVQGAPSW